MPKLQVNKLAAALRQKAHGPEAVPTVVTASEPPMPKETTRRGKVMVSGWLPIEARSSFRLIQAKHPEKRMQDLVEEAMNDLFAKYNVPQTAKVTAE